MVLNIYKEARVSLSVQRWLKRRRCQSCGYGERRHQANARNRCWYPGATLQVVDRVDVVDTVNIGREPPIGYVHSVHALRANVRPNCRFRGEEGCGVCHRVARVPFLFECVRPCPGDAKRSFTRRTALRRRRASPALPLASRERRQGRAACFLGTSIPRLSPFSSKFLVPAWQTIPMVTV